MWWQGNNSRRLDKVRQMRSSKSRSRSKSNRQRSLGNIVNRVFDSSGPEGKVRGTPQQIIDKYLTLARDAQLSNDRVAEQAFLQHAEHYTRMLGEAQREQAERQQQQQQQQNNHNNNQNQHQQGHQQNQQSDGQRGEEERDPRAQPGNGAEDQRRANETSEDQPSREDKPRDEKSRANGRDRSRAGRSQPREAAAQDAAEQPGSAENTPGALPDAIDATEEGPVETPERAEPKPRARRSTTTRTRSAEPRSRSRKSAKTGDAAAEGDAVPPVVEVPGD